jgi:hypothetical protein
MKICSTCPIMGAIDRVGEDPIGPPRKRTASTSPDASAPA